MPSPQRPPRPRLPFSFLVPALTAVGLALGSTSCEAIKEALDAEDRPPVMDVEAPQPEILPEPATPVDVGTPEPAVPIGVVPLERSKKANALPGKGASNLGFHLADLAHPFALAGAVEVPSWSVSSDADPRKVRDGDLASVWSCTPGKDERCAIGLHFPEPAQIKAVRLFAAGGEDLFQYGPQLRPRKVRLHTEEGWVDTILPDVQDYVYVVLGEPISTRNLGVEFLDFWDATDDTLYLGDLEVYAVDGAPREPSKIDARRAFVTWEESPWKKQGDRWDPQATFVQWVDPEGQVRTFAPGSALRGRADDRLFLLERMEVGTCSRPTGTYFLFDRSNHMLAPLGELGGVGGDLYRREDGAGLVLGYVDEDFSSLTGVVLDEQGEYLRKRTALREDRRSKDPLGDWKFDRTPVLRRGVSLSEQPQGCQTASDDLLVELSKAKNDRKTESKPGEWQVCDLGGGTRAFLTDRGPCGKSWEVHVLDAQGELMGSATRAAKGSHLRIVRVGPSELMVEATGMDDSGSVIRLHPQGADVLTEHGALALPLPAGCRHTCEDQHPNPAAPL